MRFKHIEVEEYSIFSAVLGAGSMVGGRFILCDSVLARTRQGRCLRQNGGVKRGRQFVQAITAAPFDPRLQGTARRTEERHRSGVARSAPFLDAGDDEFDLVDETAELQKSHRTGRALQIVRGPEKRIELVLVGNGGEGIATPVPVFERVGCLVEKHVHEIDVGLHRFPPRPFMRLVPDGTDRR